MKEAKNSKNLSYLYKLLQFFMILADPKVGE